MRRAAAAALLLLLGGAAGAQEFDIFELSDFVDPRVRGAEYDEDGLTTKDPGYPFFVSRITLGGVSDYYWRTTATGANVAVLQSKSSVYWGANQLNLKVTRLETNRDSAWLPETRATVQLARYTARQNRARGEKPPEVVISRYLVGVAVEESPDSLENLAGHRSLNYELAAEVDVRVPFTDFIGTMSYVKRFAGEGMSTQRFAYAFHTRLHDYRRVNFDISLAVGAEKTSTWRWGDVRPTVHMRMPLDKVGTVIHAAYAPTVSFESGFLWRHEVALFVDRAIFAKVFSGPPTPE